MIIGRWLVALLCILSACSPGGAERRGPKNILLIVADTLRADHLGCYGFKGETSPRIDELARQGIVFDQYQTVVPTTLASFTSLLTSLHPKDHGAFRNGFEGDLSLPRLPRLSEVFREGGFETAAFIASYCLSAEFGMNRGFDHFDEKYTGQTPFPDNKVVRNAASVTDGLIEWAENRDGKKPFFAMVHYFDPHWPYDPPERFWPFFDANMNGLPTPRPSYLLAQEHLKASGGVPGDFERNLHNLYCAEIRYVDEQVGRALDRLAELGLLDDTLVIFTADHGETFWDHEDYFSHGLGVYQSTLHIPLVFFWPRGIGPGRCDALLCNIDLAPTLLGLANLPSPAAFEGRSFADQLFGESAPPLSDLFAEATKPIDVEEGAARPNLLKAKSICRGPWKLIDYPYEDHRCILFNLDEDPLEMNDLFGLPGQEERAGALRERLDEWAGRYRRPAGARTTLSPEAEEKLHELGY